ncbi:MAG: hypothetical protein JSS34_08555 [Proteobacteria bacterium]|nr:hypothetical protein [Pseudomonadota bacterium]
MPKTTKRFVESIVPDSKNVLMFWDTKIKEFSLVVRLNGQDPVEWDTHPRFTIYHPAYLLRPLSKKKEAWQVMN